VYKPAQLVVHTVEISGEGPQFVPIGRFDPPEEITRRDFFEPDIHLFDRRNDRPGNRKTEDERQRDAPDRESDDYPLGADVGAAVLVDPRHDVGLGPVHQLIGKALQVICQRGGLRELELARLDAVAGAGQFDDLGHDGGELFVIGLDPLEQIGLVLGHKLEPLEVIAEKVELAQRRIERLLVGRQQGRGDAVELGGGVVLELAVGSHLFL